MKVVGRLCGKGPPLAIAIRGETIESVHPATEGGPQEGTIGGPEFGICAVPFDIQVNGFDGRSFNANGCSAEDVAAVTDALHRNGVGLYCPTVTTGAFERMAASLRAIVQACETPAVGNSVVAIHMEGPYISAEDGPRGAHALSHVRPPDWDEFYRLQDAAQGRLPTEGAVLLTIADKDKAGSIVEVARSVRKLGFQLSIPLLSQRDSLW